jgi:hypothetical protein
MTSRFDKYLRDDKTIKGEGEQTPPTSGDAVWKSKFFLAAASVMIVLAIVAYAFQGSFFTDENDIGLEFLYVLFFAVMGAFFFLMAYKNRKLGMTLLGRKAELGEAREKVGGASYDMFKTEGAAEEKIQQTQRKKARHDRHRFAGTKVSNTSGSDQD